jgi:hypothetical protein
VLTNQANRLVELADHRIEVLPMPTRSHQMTLGCVFRALDAVMRARGGLVLFALLRPAQGGRPPP